MSGAKPIPALHRAIAAAAVKAALGERAVIVGMVAVPSTPALGGHVDALECGIRTFWSRWTGRKSNGSSITDETSD